MARELQNVLFPIRDGAIFIGTFRDNDIMYDEMIKAFDRAIGYLGKEVQGTACSHDGGGAPECEHDQNVGVDGKWRKWYLWYQTRRIKQVGRGIGFYTLFEISSYYYCVTVVRG